MLADRINNKASICVAVLIFAILVTWIVNCFSVAINSRTPDIINSRNKITIPENTHALCKYTNITMRDITNILSAIGSKQRPKDEQILYLRAKEPSSLSVAQAMHVRMIDMMFVTLVFMYINIHIIGAKHILVIVSILGTTRINMDCIYSFL